MYNINNIEGNIKLHSNTKLIKNLFNGRSMRCLSKVMPMMYFLMHYRTFLYSVEMFSPLFRNGGLPITKVKSWVNEYDKAFVLKNFSTKSLRLTV